MGQKAESLLQMRLQRLITKRGGYVKKNHGNMITVKGLSDLSFTYRGLSLYWEVKTRADATNVTVAQGIHCRLAKKAGGVPCIISDLTQAEAILDCIDASSIPDSTLGDVYRALKQLYQARRLDDGSSY